MSPSEPTPITLSDGPWPELDSRERRVLSVLVEKQKTSKTADTYPMTLNALTTGCNQKSNRDPIMSLSEAEVSEALSRCQKKGLAFRITGSRVERWRHALYEVWRVDKVELALLAELLLRGPQSEGELRTRASRMDAIDDLETLRNVLRPLVQRKLVVYLTAEERRGAMLTHGFHVSHELEALRARAEAQPLPLLPPSPVSPSSLSPSSELMERLMVETSELRSENLALKSCLEDLQKRLDTLEGEVRSLQQALGVG